jgi:hypothetical protein
MRSARISVFLIALLVLVMPVVLADVDTRIIVQYKSGYDIHLKTIEARNDFLIENFNSTTDDYGKATFNFIYASGKQFNVSIMVKEDGKIVRIKNNLVTKLGTYETGETISINLLEIEKPKPKKEPEKNKTHEPENTTIAPVSVQEEQPEENTEEPQEQEKTEQNTALTGNVISEPEEKLNSNIIYFVIFGVLFLGMMGAVIFLMFQNRSLKKDSGFYSPPGQTHSNENQEKTQQNTEKKPEYSKFQPVFLKAQKNKGKSETWISDEEKELIEAEKKIKEAQEEINRIKNQKKEKFETEKKYREAKEQYEQYRKQMEKLGLNAE